MIHKSEWFNIIAAIVLLCMFAALYFKPMPELDAAGITNIIEEYVPLPRVRPFTQAEIVCMTDNVYHEARGESGLGQRAVVDVVMNRMQDPEHRWPRDVCGVVYQPFAFSWTSTNATVDDIATWFTIKLRVKVWMESHDKGIVDANHYHTLDINTDWDNNMVEEKIIGMHAFFEG